MVTGTPKNPDAVALAKQRWADKPEDYRRLYMSALAKQVKKGSEEARLRALKAWETKRLKAKAAS